jgi:hypothetical protein
MSMTHLGGQYGEAPGGGGGGAEEQAGQPQQGGETAPARGGGQEGQPQRVPVPVQAKNLNVVVEWK